MLRRAIGACWGSSPARTAFVQSGPSEEEGASGPVYIDTQNVVQPRPAQAVVSELTGAPTKRSRTRHLPDALPAVPIGPSRPSGRLCQA